MNDVREREVIPQAEDPAGAPQPPAGLVGLSKAFEGMRDDRDLACDEMHRAVYRRECAEARLKDLRMRLHQYVYCSTPAVKAAARSALLADAIDFDHELARLLAEREQQQEGGKTA